MNIDNLDKYLQQVEDPNVGSVLKILIFIAHEQLKEIEWLKLRIADQYNRIEEIKNDIKILDWRIDNPNEDYYE